MQRGRWWFGNADGTAQEPHFSFTSCEGFVAIANSLDCLPDRQRCGTNVVDQETGHALGHCVPPSWVHGVEFGEAFACETLLADAAGLCRIADRFHHHAAQ